MSDYIFSDNKVAQTYNAYPNTARLKLLILRELVFDCAKELDADIKITETLKWGEPSYLCKTGSTIRLAWLQSKPNQIGVYLNCKTTLVATIKEIYPTAFSFEGKRALIFDLSDDLPIAALKHVFSLALNYHKVKHLPLLGA